MVSFPFEKGKKLYKKKQRLKQWQIICEQQRHNWQNYIFIACALPSPPPKTWMERDIVRIRSPDQEHNKMTPVGLKPGSDL